MRRSTCRLLVENDGAEWPLSRKFGTTVETARALMIRAGEMGLDAYGLSFHVGSQQTYDRRLRGGDLQGRMLFTDLKRAGVDVRMVNLGGGYPVRYRDEIPGIDRFAEAIMRAMTQSFGNSLPQMLVEPGTLHRR